MEIQRNVTDEDCVLSITWHEVDFIRQAIRALNRYMLCIEKGKKPIRDGPTLRTRLWLSGS
jgi:hypothetical protein